MIHTLYICYFGLNEPLVQSQVLPYLRHLADAGIDVSLLTFESGAISAWSDVEKESARRDLIEDGIQWSSLSYHKWPSVPATAYDVFRGAAEVLRIKKAKGVEVLHARAHIPLIIALLANLFSKSRVIFDLRGLVADEYVDAGVWKRGSIPYRVVKYFEKLGIRRADQVIVLTEKARTLLRKEYERDLDSVEVIPCCVQIPSEVSATKSQKGKPLELVYAGSVTGLYLLEEMGRFFLELKKTRPDAFFRILTFADPGFVERVFHSIGVTTDSYSVQRVLPSKVVSELRSSQLAISFRKPTFSQIAASPTKLPEYLAAGLPVVTNSGIGDSDEILTESGTGIIVDDFTSERLSEAAATALSFLERPNIAEVCVATAQRYFDLHSVGGARYERVYERLANAKANAKS